MRYFSGLLLALFLIPAILQAQNRLDSLETAYKTAKASGDHKTAFQNYREFILLRDSLNNESGRKAAIKTQLKYEYIKKPQNRTGSSECKKHL